MRSPPRHADDDRMVGRTTVRASAYPIFASQRARSRRGGYLLAIAFVLVVALALRLI